MTSPDMEPIHNNPPDRTCGNAPSDLGGGCTDARPAPQERREDCAEDDFFRQVSIEFLIHELKDPVSVIETGARMLLEKHSGDVLSLAQQRTLERVLRNARKSRDMLAELLEVGRAQNVCFHCRPFRPMEAVRQVLMQAVEANDPELYDQMKQQSPAADPFLFLSSSGIRLDVASAAEGLTIEQDEIKFCHIVGNLIKNGLSYKRRHLLIHLAVQRERFSVSVRDDGPGIAPVHQEAIFQRYKQVAPCAGMARGGHGLGLAVARILARSLGGDITVESELGLGALFCFSLPVSFNFEQIS